MAVRLENLTSRPVTLVLNSGSVLHLPPGHASEQPAVEVEQNAKVQRLREALVIAVGSVDPSPEQAAPADDVAPSAPSAPSGPSKSKAPGTPGSGAAAKA
jgi:hypothetical protein